ncbi:GNAT family N-acetyltransferase [Floricoccus penangensis]|uniref:GNAT family N-acetyltransferase n=1 Tax=Floricoccus penangensis TaxID=1859475 RepID=A0A9Q5JE51_9LACT|nr:GNAT family N-acetyltransferase [Floricoccus penangensis]OFI45711.1 GNAT family N-acetyltransferase [Floricoccus penangensis]
MWHSKKLTEISSLDFYKIEKLRIDTFVVEQKRIFHDLDDNDLSAYHVYYKNEEDEVLAYARIFEHDGHVTFGRVVITSASRGLGLGKELTQELVEVYKSKWPDKELIIEAQSYVKEFYQKNGFQTFGEIFILEGTEHIMMKYMGE